MRPGFRLKAGLQQESVTLSALYPYEGKRHERVVGARSTLYHPAHGLRFTLGEMMARIAVSAVDAAFRPLAPVFASAGPEE